MPVAHSGQYLFVYKKLSSWAEIYKYVYMHDYYIYTYVDKHVNNDMLVFKICKDATYAVCESYISLQGFSKTVTL